MSNQKPVTPAVTVPAKVAAAPPATIVRDASNSVMVRMAERFGMDRVAFEQTVRKTLMPDGKENATNEQVAAFLIVADQYGLNPFTKQIYAFPSKGGIVPIVSVDGWYKIINDHAAYDGLEFEDHLSDSGDLVAVTAKVYRKDRSHPVTVTEYMAECKRGTEMWKQWPRRMLRHKAAIQGARAAFGLSGIYDPDEGERIIEAEGRAVPASGSRTKALGQALASKPVHVEPEVLPEPPADEPHDSGEVDPTATDAPEREPGEDG